MTKEFFAKLFEKKNGIKLGIGRVAEAFPRIRTMVIPTYHVAGTNGKGTVVYALTHILSSNGLKTGRFISPHIFSYNERISIDGRNIEDSQIIDIYNCLENEIGNFEELSFFEITFLVAWKHFENEGCDRVVIEAGLGGRIDATNVIDWPKTDVITSIDFDHTHILGNTLEKIAQEKLGIVKKNDILILPQMDNLLLRQWMVSKIENIEGVRILDESKGKFLKKGMVERSVIQIQNIQIAVAAALNTESGISIPDTDSFYFPGRFEEIEKGVVIDVAHNPPAVKTLTDHIALKNEKVVVLYGAMKDKNISKCLKLLAKVSEKIFPVSIECMNRGAAVADIVSRSDEFVKTLLEYDLTDDETIKKAYLYSKQKGIKLIVTGSFYTIEKFVNWRKNADRY